MRMTLIMTAAIALTFSSAAPSFANDGISVFGGFGSTTQEFNQSRNTGSNQPNTGAAGGPSGTVVDKETGVSFFGGVGYKTHLGDDTFVRLDGFYSAEDVDTTIINNVLVNNVELNSSYGGDIKLGYDATDKLGIYGLIGATAFDFDSQISYTFAPPMDAVSETEWALTYGAGVELALSDRISTFGEVRIANDVNFTTPTDKGGVNSNNDLNFTSVRSGLRFSF